MRTQINEQKLNAEVGLRLVRSIEAQNLSDGASAPHNTSTDLR